MNRIFRLFICCALCAFDVQAQNRVLWNGENGDPSSCNKAYGSILSGADAHSGTYYFRGEPDNAHAPRIGFNCSGMWRSDISRFDELRFFIKSNLPDQATSIRFTTYFAQSKWVPLAPYFENGSPMTTEYQQVRIPLDSLKTAGYNLSSVEYLELDKHGGQVFFYLDDMEVVDLKAPRIELDPVSDRVLKLKIDERFDTTAHSDLDKYTLQSDNDQDFSNPIHPVNVGRHSYVSGLEKISGSPRIAFELFLIFDKPLKNGSNYHLNVKNLPDLAGNLGTLDSSFSFSDADIYGNVKVNQVGYLPQSPKLGKLGNFLGDAWFLPVDTLNPPAFEVVNASDEIVFVGTADFLKSDSAFCGEAVFDLDFSSLTEPGTYHLRIPGFGRSPGFSISEDVFNQTYYHTARALFFQRSGDLAETNAGIWARNGLPATTAEIHSSVASSPLFTNSDPPAGSTIPMQKGWLDAGDYGRYVPTAASALFILFTAFELYPAKFPDSHLNIPESGNNVPDILDELKYETDWLMQMQAPDGGVYFRITPATWSAGLPGEENNSLFVSEKTTQSTALFAAAMAMAYRNFKPYFPEYADLCLTKAKLAWHFLEIHQNASAPVNVPGISAGPYPDPEDRDNRAWAAAELYKSTGDPIYDIAFQNFYNQIPHQFHATMSWQQHTVKAIWAYATTNLFPTHATFVNEFKDKLESEILVNYHNRTMLTNAYHGAYHPFKGFVGYGTFGMAQSYAFDYIMFSYLLNKPELLDLAKIQLDIPLGNNPISRSFITGIGVNPPKNPLHWSTISNQFPTPVPGVPVFGPAASLVMNRPSSFAIQDSLNRYPYGFKKEDPYPVLRRYTDAREAVEMSEFTVQEMAVTAATFAFFSSINAIALPVKLQSFEAKSQDCDVVVSWTTSEEVNADYFTIEKRADARNFREIGKQVASGNSLAIKSYTFIDTSAGHRNYYRLKQMDTDGKFTYSRIVSAVNRCAGNTVEVRYMERNVYKITVASEPPGPANLKLDILNVSGIVQKTTILKSKIPILLDGADLIPGIYILRITGKNEEIFYTQKIIFY